MFLDQDSKNFDQKLTKPGNLDMEQQKIEKEDCQKELVISKSKQCSDCGSTFSSQSNLRLHVDAVHEKKKPFLCSECGDSFSTQNNLKRHITAVHKGQTTFKILILAAHPNQSATLTTDQKWVLCLVLLQVPKCFVLVQIFGASPKI